jgi:methylenetetrahydrofolate reductase (NADPH)
MARPSFDIDSVGLLSMYSEMNRGLRDAKGRKMKPTDFFLGAVVTNHKRYEREVVPQYLKLRRKIENGARFIINQAGYDARKDDELVRWLALSGLQVPVIANVFVLSLGAARAFNAGRVPGVVVTDELVALAEHYAGSADRGRSYFLELAAKQVAIARGVGFRGAYLGGKLDLADCEEILSRAAQFGLDGWKQVAGDVGFACPDEFYYFERDETTGLSTSEVNGAFLASRTKAARRRARVRTPINYRTSRLAHWAVFDPEAPLFEVARRFYSAVDSAPVPMRKVLHLLEHVSKVPLYNCKDCGDCSLPEIAYLCSESQCAKNQRNGPCGGSHDGLCEVAERECIWARAYERLKPYGEEDSMLDGPVVFTDNALSGTSAWANTFLGRDHTARSAAGQEDVK